MGVVLALIDSGFEWGAVGEPCVVGSYHPGDGEEGISRARWQRGYGICDYGTEARMVDPLTAGVSWLPGPGVVPQSRKLKLQLVLAEVVKQPGGEQELLHLRDFETLRVFCCQPRYLAQMGTEQMRGNRGDRVG